MPICSYGLESDLLLINKKEEKDYIIVTYEDVALRYSWIYPKPRYIKCLIFSSIDKSDLIKLTNNILDWYNLYSDTFNFKICLSNCYIEIIIKDNKYGVIRNTKIKVIFYRCSLY